MRKGELTTDQTAMMVLMAIMIVVLVAWFVFYKGSIEDKRDVELCRTSVMSYATLRLDTVDIPGVSREDYHVVDVNCQRRVLTFTENEVELNGERHRFYDVANEKSSEKYSALTGDVVNSIAASEMSTCWYQFLEGKVRWTNQLDLKNSRTACFICSELRFEGDFSYTQTPFFDFLRTHDSKPYPFDVAGSKIDYFRYLYEQPRICDYDESYLPKFVLGYMDSFKYEGVKSCPDEFYDFMTFDWRTAQWSWSKFGIVEGEIPPPNLPPNSIEHSKRKSILDPEIRLTPDNTYLILFYQQGKDWGETEDGLPTGVSYAPLIIRNEDLDSKLCSSFIG